MLAQAVQNPKVAGKPVKPQYRPHIRRESADTFSVQSERYVHVLYVQRVLENGLVTCDCAAGSYGRPCKHAKIIAAYVAYNAHQQHIRPQQEEEVAQVAAAEPLTWEEEAEIIFMTRPMPDFAYAQKRIPAMYTPAPAALSECYA